MQKTFPVDCYNMWRVIRKNCIRSPIVCYFDYYTKVLLRLFNFFVLLLQYKFTEPCTECSGELPLRIRIFKMETNKMKNFWMIKERIKICKISAAANACVCSLFTDDPPCVSRNIRLQPPCSEFLYVGTVPGHKHDPTSKFAISCK